MDRIPFLVARYPAQALTAGKLMLIAGSVMVLSAVFGRARLADVNEARLQGKLAPLRTLAEAFPDYPTWFVPESVVGFGVAAALVVAGVTLVHFAERATKRT